MNNELYIKNHISHLKPLILGSNITASNIPIFDLFNTTIVKIDCFKNLLWIESRNFDINQSYIILCEIGSGTLLITNNGYVEFKNIKVLSNTDLLQLFIDYS